MRSIISLFLLILSLCASARTFLVSVGVSDYSAYPAVVSDLALTTNDAKAIAKLYSKNGSTKYSLLLNDQATKDNVIRTIKKVFSKANKNDIVVFFFSGHGYPGGFCVYDGNLSYSDIRNAMSRSKSKCKLMFIDACLSGGMRVDDSSAQGAITAAKNANVILFLSSRTKEYSMERKDMNNGFFTTYLCNGLKGNADANRDRIITARELFDFVHTKVTHISNGKQHPVMWGKFDDNTPIMQW